MPDKLLCLTAKELHIFYSARIAADSSRNNINWRHITESILAKSHMVVHTVPKSLGICRQETITSVKASLQLQELSMQ